MPPAGHWWLLPQISSFSINPHHLPMNFEFPFLLFIFGIAAFVVVGVARERFRHEFIVNEGHAGLLYHEGQLIGTLTTGRHVRWGRHFCLALVEVRRTLLQVAGQEVLTADNVGLKASVVLTIQVTDAAKSVQAADSHVTHLYSAAQAALRSTVAGVTMEALLCQRVAIGPQLRELIAPQAEAFGVTVHAVELRDVMLPGELRKAFSEVLKAKQEAHVVLERARSESAALRNLANAARLVEDIPALATLRFLQSIENMAGQSVIMNDLSAFLPSLTRRVSKSAFVEGGDAQS
jgi:regulator of protease activity HflC (stomatin/prohibitin superfamily)